MSYLLRTFSTLPRATLAPASRRVSSIAAHIDRSAIRPVPFRTMASSSLPKTMKGVLIEETGGTDVLQYKTDLPLPEPKEGQILVKNDFIGVNYIDT